MKTLKTLVIVATTLSLVVAKAEASSSLFNIVADSSNVLRITTNIPNHLYPNAGIIVNTPGYSVGLGPGLAFNRNIPATQCTHLSNGYCKFAVSASEVAYIPVFNTNAPVTIKSPSPTSSVPVNVSVCLNALGPLSCQNFTFNYLNVI